MVDTNGYNIIQDTAQKAKDYMDKNQWLDAYKMTGYTQHTIRKQTSNINSYNILTKLLVTSAVIVISCTVFPGTKVHFFHFNLK